MEKIKFTPLLDKILVKPVAEETTTPSGIFIPNSAREKPQKGYVVAIGKGIKGKALVVKVGDNILYSKNSGSEIKMEDETYLIMKECEIFAII